MNRKDPVKIIDTASTANYTNDGHRFKANVLKYGLRMNIWRFYTWDW